MRTLWTSDQISRATGGTSSGFWAATGLSMDSRLVQPGDLFIALKGPQSDGHDFILDAFKKGAAAVLVDHLPNTPLPGPYTLASNTYDALMALAQEARRRTHGHIAGVTGSFGKTGCKEALRHVLSAQDPTTATARSFNNKWGVPFSLATLFEDDSFGVFEIGMNRPGEIKPLSELVQPHVALITTVEEMHRENFESLQGIAHEKSQIFQGMAAGSIAVLNKDNRMFSYLERQAQEKGLKVLSFGQHPEADVRLMHFEFQDGLLKCQVCFQGKNQKISYVLNVLGDHWALNSTGILAVVEALGASVEKAAQSLNTFKLPEGRGAARSIPYQGGTVTLLDESYNAGPESMRAAIRGLGRAPVTAEGRRIAVLGDMLELGDQAQALHQSLLKDLLENKIDLVFTSGPWMETLYQILPEPLKGASNTDPDQLAQKLISLLKAGDAVMVKGSRGQYNYRGRMFKIVEKILALSGEEETKVSLQKF